MVRTQEGRPLRYASCDAARQQLLSTCSLKTPPKHKPSDIPVRPLYIIIPLSCTWETEECR